MRDVGGDPRLAGKNFGNYDLFGKGYRAKTILAYPILNRMGEVEGVVEAVNKCKGADGEMRYFSEDDEGLLKMLARIAGVSLRNSVLHGEAHFKHNNLRSILACGVFLNTLRSSKELQQGAENRLTQLFTSSDAKVWFLNNAEKTIWRYDQDNQKVSYRRDMGIVGQAICKKTVIAVSDPNLEFCYNSLIDINTTMPILAVPIKDSFTGTILGGFEVINSKGIEGLSTTGNAKVMGNDYDVLDFFSKQLAQCILNQSDKHAKRACLSPKSSADDESIFSYERVDTVGDLGGMDWEPSLRNTNTGLKVVSSIHTLSPGDVGSREEMDKSQADAQREMRRISRRITKNESGKIPGLGRSGKDSGIGKDSG